MRKVGISRRENREKRPTRLPSRSSPYKVNSISSRQVMRIKEKCQLGGLLVDPILNSPNLHYKNCIADSKENYYRDPVSERVKKQ